MNPSNTPSKILSAEKWRALLALGTKLNQKVFIRTNQRGGSQHFGHGTLESVVNEHMLIVRPDSDHQKDEEMNRADVHFWRTKTIKNPSGGIPENELDEVLKNGSKTSEVILGTFKGDEIVLVDLGNMKFYAGYESNRPTLTDELCKSETYGREGHASRSAGRINQNASFMSQLSETGLIPFTVREVWAIKRNVLSYSSEHGHMIPVRKLSEMNATNPSVAMPYLKGVKDSAPESKLTKKNASADNGHLNGHTNGHNGHPHNGISALGILTTNGHHNGHANGHANGHTNGANGRLAAMFPSEDPSIALLIESAKLTGSNPMFQMIMGANKACEEADSNVRAAMAMLQEALAEQARANKAREMLLTQAALASSVDSSRLLGEIKSLIAEVRELRSAASTSHEPAAV